MTPRYRAIDLARGLAVAAMVLSHGVRLLLDDPRPYPGPRSAWFWPMLGFKALVPAFFVCFGFMLGAIYANPSRPWSWRRHGALLLQRGLLVLAAYKALVVLELRARGATWPQIGDALAWRGFAAWVEVLDFYAVAIVVAALGLGAWRRVPLLLKLAAVAALLAALPALQRAWPARWDLLQAFLVGRRPHHVFPILPWAVPVLLGLVLGERVDALRAHGRWPLAACCVAGAAALLGTFRLAAGDRLHATTVGIVNNLLKHPPHLSFVALSVAGALLVLAACVAIMGLTRAPPARWNPLELLGRQPLPVFLFHFVALFGLGGLASGALERLPARAAWGWSLALLAACVVVAAAWERLGSRPARSSPAPAPSAEESPPPAVATAGRGTGPVC